MLRNLPPARTPVRTTRDVLTALGIISQGTQGSLVGAVNKRYGDPDSPNDLFRVEFGASVVEVPREAIEQIPT